MLFIGSLIAAYVVFIFLAETLSPFPAKPYERRTSVAKMRIGYVGGLLVILIALFLQLSSA